ncbi:hypothetical protein A8975_0425 [Meridianimaribacter flavus]|uniref:Uncharacterized protein n=1 Tax=Meridianimaribacter flavus TaxID=571115 RepID=A0ABY2GA14_9FLAO|nr:hypothetical protein A8975_0425 [Meridianimaribacter flavus]
MKIKHPFTLLLLLYLISFLSYSQSDCKRANETYLDSQNW